MAGDLLDTCIIIDALRRDDRAARFIDGISSAGPCCPDVVFAELLHGCRDQTELRRLSTIVRDRLGIAVHDAADARKAIELLESCRLSQGMGYLDCVLAAMAIHREASLHTHNVKHFRAIPGLRLHRPY